MKDDFGGIFVGDLRVCFDVCDDKLRCGFHPSFSALDIAFFDGLISETADLRCTAEMILGNEQGADGRTESECLPLGDLFGGWLGATGFILADVDFLFAVTDASDDAAGDDTFRGNDG